MAAVMPPSEQAMERTVDISGAERELKVLEKKGGLTKAGREWFEVAVDPFHDRAIELEGYPDGDQGATVVQVIKRTVTFGKPSSITDGTWDAHISMLPQLFGGAKPGAAGTVATASDRGTTYLLGEGVSGLTGATTGAVTVTCVPTGTTSASAGWSYGTQGIPMNAGGGASDRLMFGISPTSFDGTSTPGTDSAYLDGASRCIAMGFEVVNTTAPLYQQGSCLVWRQNASFDEQYKYQVVDDSPLGNVVVVPASKADGTLDIYNGVPAIDRCFSFRGPPAFVSDAMLLPDARQWHAKEGCYVVARQSGDENPFELPEQCLVFALGDDPVFPGYSPNAYSSQAPAATLLGPAPFGTVIGSADIVRGQLFPPTSKKRVPFDTSGAIFSGLSLQTTLTLNCRWVIERAPTRTESDLVVIAKPSPEYDETAFRLYTEARRLMPPGAMLRDNWAGAWFKQAVSNVIPSVVDAASAADPRVGALVGAVKQLKDRMAAKKGGKKK